MSRVREVVCVLRSGLLVTVGRDSWQWLTPKVLFFGLAAFTLSAVNLGRDVGLVVNPGATTLTNESSPAQPCMGLQGEAFHLKDMITSCELA